MKRTLVFFMCVLLCASVWSVGSKKAKQTGMTWSNWVGAEAANKEQIVAMLQAYNDKASGENKVTQINWPWGDTITQLSTRYQGKESYDIAQIDIRMLPALAEAGFLADVTPLFTQKYLTDNFDQGSLAVGKYKGVQYGVPWTIAPIALIANPKILAEAGITGSVTTIAQFEDALKKVKENHPNNKDSDTTNDIIPYAVMTKDAGTTAPDFMPWLWTFGASIFDVNGNAVTDSAKAVETFTWFNSLSTKGYIKTGISRGDARTLFQQGKAAFYDDSLTAKASITNNSFGNLESYAKPSVRPVKNVGDKPQALSWGHLFVLIKRSSKQADSVNFIKNMLSVEQSISYFEKCGMIPTLKAALENTMVTSDYWSNSWKPILAGGRLSETAGTKESAYNTIITEELQSLFSGSKTPAAVGTSMKARLTAAK